MGLFGSVLGYLAGGRAAKSVSDANIAAEHGVLGATRDGQAGIGNAITGANDRTNAAFGGLQDQTALANQKIGVGYGDANQTLGQSYGVQAENLSPYLQGGRQGITSLADYAANRPSFHAPTAEEVQNTPGYQFQLQQGSNAITNQASASGLSQGGNTLKALAQYGQGLAGTYYQNAFNNAKSSFDTNHNATMNTLGALINSGQNATQQFDSASQNYGNRASINQSDSNRLQAVNSMNTANAGVSLAQFLSSLGLQGSEASAGLGLQGSRTAGEFAVGAGQSHGAGIMNQGAALTSGVGQLGGLLGQLFPGLGMN